MSGHNPHHDHNHGHHHHGEGGSGRALLLALSLTLAYSGVEALAGWWSGSLALLGDAAHMLTDSLSLGLAAGAALMASRPPSLRHSYGFGRLETLAALVNALLMIALVAAISAEAVDRILSPRQVQGGAVAGVAVAGLAINLVAAWLLSSGKQNLNVRAALLHVMGDLLGSVAALISGIVIVWTGWTTVDPILSLVIALLILLSSFGILRDALHALMEGVPTHLDLDEIGHALAQIEGVRGVHDLHIWSLSAERTALSAHLLVRDMGSWPEVLRLTNELLQERFDIVHSTLQPEPMEQLVPLQIRPLDPCPESEAPSG